MASVEKAGSAMEAAETTAGEGATTGAGHDDGEHWPLRAMAIDFHRSVPAAKVSGFLPSLVLVSSIDTQAKRDLEILFQKERFGDFVFDSW